MEYQTNFEITKPKFIYLRDTGETGKTSISFYFGNDIYGLDDDEASGERKLVEFVKELEHQEILFERENPEATGVTLDIKIILADFLGKLIGEIVREECDSELALLRQELAAAIDKIDQLNK